MASRQYQFTRAPVGLGERVGELSMFEAPQVMEFVLSFGLWKLGDVPCNRFFAG
jgi:hypothetical protein